MASPERDEDRRPETIALLAVALRPPVDASSYEAPFHDLRSAVGGTGPLSTWIEEAGRRARTVRMDREYHRLFLGPGRPIAPPFESVYRDRSMFGEAAKDFLRELRAVGLAPSEGFGLPPDHIALELEYVVQLDLRARDAGAHGRFEEAALWSERSRTFVEDHLARWLPPFLRRLEEGAPGSPYTLVVRAAAELLRLRGPGPGRDP
ncbi:MAG: hypothetical protein A3K68_02600 [Euryarchaeota archaeon RBG_16_68_13]|nr:MAG: hypothetical protein A3K68_02600 [Euryarchaeota archaeon RBG_16_68_13]